MTLFTSACHRAPSEQAPTEPKSASPVAAAGSASPSNTKFPPPPDVSSPPVNATRAEAGIAYKILKPGNGKDVPGPYDRVKIAYTAWTAKGESFDSSEFHGAPQLTDMQTGFIRGLREGLALMSQGGKARIWIPPDMAWGDAPPDKSNPAGSVTYDVELLEVERFPEAPAAPLDVAAPPLDATKTASGLSFRVLQPGKGQVHPTDKDVVRVVSTGWTTDGKLFDSSLQRHEPSTIHVGRTIKGWTEALQLMVEGEKIRIWVPSDLAYGKSRRQGDKGDKDYTFDIELVQIVGKSQD